MTEPTRSGEARGRTWMLAALWAVARAFAVVAAIMFPGGMLNAYLHREFQATSAITLILLAVAAVTAILARLLGVQRPLPRAFGWAVTIGSAALIIAVIVLRPQPAPMNDRVLLSDLPLIVYASNLSINDCRLPPKCRTYNLSNHGLRSPHRARPSPDAPMAAIIGDSFVFGYGVDDQDTMPSALQRHLQSHSPPITLGNGGLEGTSLASFPSMVRYSQRVFNPDLFVVLIKHDDLEEGDLVTRRVALVTNPLVKVASALNLEILTEVFRQFVFLNMPSSTNTDYLAARLDDLVTAAQGRRLLLVTDLGEREANAALEIWLDSHPDVGWFSTRNAPEWNSAPRIPGDGHWTPEGNELIAKILAEPIARMFESKQPVRPTSGVAGGDRAPSAEQ